MATTETNKPRETALSSSWRRSERPLPILKPQTYGGTFLKCVPKPLLLRVTGPTVYPQVNYSVYQTNSVPPDRQSVGSDRAHPMCEEVSRV